MIGKDSAKSKGRVSTFQLEVEVFNPETLPSDLPYHILCKNFKLNCFGKKQNFTHQFSLLPIAVNQAVQRKKIVILFFLHFLYLFLTVP